jgi:myosin heavy chain 6/7
MPKVVQQEGDDPDPAPYLFVSLEQKRIDQTKPYDAKKACWVPDEKEGYVLGEIKATKGDLVTVNLPNGEVSTSQPTPTRTPKQRTRRTGQSLLHLGGL